MTAPSVTLTLSLDGPPGAFSSTNGRGGVSSKIGAIFIAFRDASLNPKLGKVGFFPAAIDDVICERTTSGIGTNGAGTIPRLGRLTPSMS